MTEKTGTIKKVTSQPRGFTLHVPVPLPDGEDIVYAPVTADDLLLAALAKRDGATVRVVGEPPNCTCVVME